MSAPQASAAAGPASSGAAGGAGGGGAGASAMAKPKYAPLMDETLIIFWVGLGIFALCILANLPRLLARLLSGTRAGEWGKGMWFADKGRRNSPLRQYATGLKPASPTQPKHFPAWEEIMPGSSVLGYQIPYTRGYTIGQMMVLVVYAALVGVALGLHDPEKAPKNAGQIAIFQMPLAVILGIPMSPAATLLGVTYKKVIFLHKAVGRMLFVTSAIHVGVFTHKWIVAGTWSDMAKKQKFVGGYVAMAAVLFILLTSLPIVRARLQGLFRICHFIGLGTTVVGLAFHMPRTGLIATIALAIYAGDIFLRLFKVRFKRAYLTTMPACASTQITIPNVTSGWRAGQYVYVRCPTLRKMGGMCWTENHPFSIASAEGGQLILVVRKRGDWTRALYDLASESRVESEKGGKEGTVRCKVIIEGPFGGPGPALIPSYSGVILVAGGSGITYALGVFEDTVHKADERASRNSSLTLIWMIKSHDECRPFMDHLRSLIRLAGECGLTAKVFIYVTRSTKEGSEEKDGVTLHHIRPAISTVIEANVARCETYCPAEEKMSGVYIGVCGPRALIRDVDGAVRDMSWDSKRRVGGVNLHKEFFEV